MSDRAYELAREAWDAIALVDSSDGIVREVARAIRKREREVLEEAAGAVAPALASCRLQHTRTEDDDGLPLLDALTPPGDVTVERGMREVELLADAIAGGIVDIAPKETDDGT